MGPSHLLFDPFLISGSAWLPPRESNPLPLPTVCPELPSQSTPPTGLFIASNAPCTFVTSHPCTSSPSPAPSPVCRLQWPSTLRPHQWGSPCGESRGRERVWGFGSTFFSSTSFFFSFSSFVLNICKKTPSCCETKLPCNVCQGLSITNMFKGQKCFN